MRKNRTLIASDNIGRTCGCQTCIDAGVQDEPMRRVPGPDGKTPIWLHGHELASWLKSYRALRNQFGQVVGEKDMEKR